MVTVLHEIKRHNVVWFYLRSMFYEESSGIVKVVKEKHLRSATLGDVADVLKPSLVSTRRILKIVGAWVGIGNLVALSSDLSQARKDEYYNNVICGMLITMGFAALHARINKVSSKDVLNKLYLDALQSTVSDFKIEKVRAFGLPLTDEAVNKVLTPSVKVDGKGRVTIPKFVKEMFGWKPGDSLQPRINLEKEEITFSLIRSKRVPRVPLQVCERYLELPEGFFHFCFDNNPLTENELKKAIDEDMDMLSILLEDTPDVPIYFRKIFGTRMRVRARYTQGIQFGPAKRKI